MRRNKILQTRFIYRNESFGSICYDSDLDKIFVNQDIRLFPAKHTRVVNNQYPNMPKLSAPITTFLELTQKCNSHCRHCINVRTTKSDDITLGEMKTIIDKLHDSGIFILKITGGEPFCRNDIFDILDYIETKMMKYIVYTNGSYINSLVASRLKDYHYLSCIRVSIDGLEKTNDFIRGDGMFRLAINALNLLSSYKITCEANFTISNINYQELSKLSEFFSHANMNVKINIGTLKISGSVMNQRSLIIPQDKTEEIMTDVKIQIMSDSSFVPYKLLPDVYFKIFGNSFGCPAGRISISIDSRGNVFGCGMFSDDETFNCGNLIHDSFANIWNGEKMAYLRNLSVREECLACSHFTQSCTGGCRGNALSCFSDISKADINCAIYKLTYN
jgi:radical SAM protein with 4Fe4S-binding SPASM domain